MARQALDFFSKAFECGSQKIAGVPKAKIKKQFIAKAKTATRKEMVEDAAGARSHGGQTIRKGRGRGGQTIREADTC
jgi:hypothetical protein